MTVKKIKIPGEAYGVHKFKKVSDAFRSIGCVWDSYTNALSAIGEERMIDCFVRRVITLYALEKRGEDTTDELRRVKKGCCVPSLFMFDFFVYDERTKTYYTNKVIECGKSSISVPLDEKRMMILKEIWREYGLYMYALVTIESLDRFVSEQYKHNKFDTDFEEDAYHYLLNNLN